MHRAALAHHQMPVQKKSQGFPASLAARGTQTFHLGASAEIQRRCILNN